MEAQREEEKQDKEESRNEEGQRESRSSQEHRTGKFISMANYSYDIFDRRNKFNIIVSSQHFSYNSS